VKKPAGTVTLSSEDGEVLIAQVHQSNLPPASAGRVESIIRMYFWLVFALQEAKLSVKRLRTLLFGSSAQPEEQPASEASATASEAPGQTAGGGEGASGREAAVGAATSEAQPKPQGGHRPGTGRLGAEAYVGAERMECRHEDLAVGQRCPLCGQGTLYALPPGVELELYDEIDDETGLYNARHLLHQTDLEMARARRYRTLFSLAVVELPAGPLQALTVRQRRAALRDLGRQLLEGLRSVDHVVHVRDGDTHRLVAILPETGSVGAAVFGDRLDERVRRFLAARGATVAAGDGASRSLTYPGDDEEVDRLRSDFQRIDAALHR